MTIFRIFTALRSVAERGIAKPKASCPFVCPSACNVEASWSSTLEFCVNNFTAIISLTFSLSADPKGNTPNFRRNRNGVRKNVDFRHLSRRISETVQDRVQVAIGY